MALALAAVGGPSEAQGATAKTMTIDYPPLGVKVPIAYPEEGHLCVIVPESAQDPVECVGLEPAAMVEALPEGPLRPFGVAYARMGEWSYIVVVAPLGTGIESKEDIDEFIVGAAKPDGDAPTLVPRVVPPVEGQQYELVQVKGVPVVKFRIDTPHPPDSPQYDIGTTLHYAAFGGKTAMVSFITSPKDVDKVLPYAEATVQGLTIPPRQSPEQFGKPRAELESQSTRLAISIFGPLIAIAALLFYWMARSKKAEDDAAPAGAPAKAAGKQDGAASEEEGAPPGDEDEKK